MLTLWVIFGVVGSNVTLIGLNDFYLILDSNPQQLMSTLGMKIYVLWHFISCSFFKYKDKKSSKVVDLPSSPPPPPEVTVDGSVRATVTQNATAANSSNIRRAVSFRPEDISHPLLQSCTNPSLDVTPHDKARAALTHSNSCSVPGAGDRTRAAGAISKITRLDDNVGIVVPLRPAPPPPSYASPKQNVSKDDVVSTKSPVSSNGSPQNESRQPSSLAPTDRETSGNADAEKQTSVVSRLRSTFEGNNTGTDSTPDVDALRDAKSSSAFRPTRPRLPPSVGKASSLSSTANSSKPALPKRPPLRRPETFSAGAQVKPVPVHLQHHASEVGGTAHKRPAFPPKPSPWSDIYERQQTIRNCRVVLLFVISGTLLWSSDRLLVSISHLRSKCMPRNKSLGQDFYLSAFMNERLTVLRYCGSRRIVMLPLFFFTSSLFTPILSWLLNLFICFCLFHFSIFHHILIIWITMLLRKIVTDVSY